MVPMGAVVFVAPVEQTNSASRGSVARRIAPERDVAQTDAEASAGPAHRTCS